VVDCSANINVLEKPTGAVDASMGDVHPMATRTTGSIRATAPSSRTPSRMR
jgi:hypothetical protein